MQIPPAPSMADIEDAFVTTTTPPPPAAAACATPEAEQRREAAAVVEETKGGVAGEAKHYVQQAVSVLSSAYVATSRVGAVAVAAAQKNSQNHQQQSTCTNGVNLPTRFMGYMDEKGVVHQEKFDSKELKLDDLQAEEEPKKAASINNTKAMATAVQEEEKQEIPASAEDILQASLNFERTNPEKRFSSSLDQLYSSASSVRNSLYPSLEDVGSHVQQEASTRQESIDSVRTTCADVVASACSMSASAKSQGALSGVVPEPPGETETTYAIAAASVATYEVEATANAAASVAAAYQDEEEDVKIGVARAELDRTDTDSPAYAVASLDNNNYYASAEATVLGTSETDEEALLAKLAAEDEELLAVKRSAYWGGYEGTPSDYGNPSQQQTASQQATVVSITEHDVHPSELSHGAVRAELIGQDYNDVPAAIGSAACASADGVAASAAAATASLASPAPASSQAVYAVEEPGYAVIDSEATIISGETTWQAEEATVLNNEDSSVPYSDRKLPAVATEQQSTPQRNNRFTATQGEVITVSEDPYFQATTAAAFGGASNVAYASVDGGDSDVAYASADGVAYADGQYEASGVAYASADASLPSAAYADGADSGVAYAAGDQGGAAYASADGVAYADGQYDAFGVAYASADGAVPSVAYGDGIAYADGAGSGVAYASAGNAGDHGATAYASAGAVTCADGQYEASRVSYASADGAVPGIAYGDGVAYAEGAGSGVAYASSSGADRVVSTVAYADGAGHLVGVASAGDQAEVVGISEDFHPAEVSGNEAQAELVATEEYGAAMAYPADNGGDQAEVVGITEDFHPAEVSGSEAQAELVAEDYGAAVALPSTGGNDQAEVVAITEEYHPAEVSGSEAQAQLVGEGYGSAVAQASSVGVEATALRADEGVGAVQAATVVGYEDEGDIFSSPDTRRASSYGGASIPNRTPPSARAYTAPAAVGTRIDPVNTPLTQAELDTVAEEDWMRTPLTGDYLTPMKPPRDGCEQPAIAVLEAYANAPSPAVDETSCSAAGYSPPAVAVTSLDAYANAPAPPPFDDTDCSMVNRPAVQPEMETQGSANFDASESSIAPTEPPTMPPPRSFNSVAQSSEAGSVSSATSGTTSTTGRGFQKIQSGFARGMEMLFGDVKPTTGRSRALDNSSLAKSVLSRQLLPWSVIYSEATNMWVATVNTNQKALDSKNVVEASKSLRAFSVVTEKQATCLAKAWSPPRMHDFKKKNACHICKAKFAVFRRACHCRNCGVAICVSSNGCSRPWPAKMCPETYNIKKESFLNVCAACDFLCTSFRLALLEGDRDKAIALHATGNINIVTPFANVKGELFYPVHCAALGGNLELLKWLVDENCCPIKSVRVSGRCRDSSNSFTEISTSKGRSLLGIALENRNVGIVRYLVVEKGIQLGGEKDITMDTLCRNLELVLRLLPEDAATGNTSDPAMASGAHLDIIHDQQQQQTRMHERASPCDDDNANTNVRAQDTASDGSVSDACIICFDRSIDCVATPCGHQVCCLDCSTNISRCPVCAVECSFMRVFRP